MKPRFPDRPAFSLVTLADLLRFPHFNLRSCNHISLFPPLKIKVPELTYVNI